MSENGNSKHHIVEVAMQLFKQDGFDSVSVMEICKNAGITRTTFYYFFQTKEDVLCEYLNSFANTKEKMFSAILQFDNDWDRYIALFRFQSGFIVNEGVEFAGMLVRAMLIHNEDGIFNETNFIKDWGTPILANCQKAGIVRDDLSAETLVTYTTRLSIGSIVSWSSTNGSFDLSREIEDAVVAYLKNSSENCTNSHNF